MIITAEATLAGNLPLVRAGPPAGTADITDSVVAVSAFIGNNLLGEVVLAYANMSYADLDRSKKMLCLQLTPESRPSADATS